MTDAVERLVNLALYLADSGGPVSRENIHAEVVGYPDGQDEAAFLRMFERDKEDLRDAGFVIESDEAGKYWLDTASTYAGEIEIDALDAAALRAAGSALLSDPGFPFAEDLRLALAKLAADLGTAEIPVSAVQADEHPAEQASMAARLMEAVEARKRATFEYTNARGEFGRRELDPYGLFARDGRWYVVGRDATRESTRVFALERMRRLDVNLRAAKTPDFERPADFDVASFILLPFQFGPESERFDALLRFGPRIAWRAPSLTAGRGKLAEDGSAVVWRVGARNRRRLARFVIENGPGVMVVEPRELAEQVREGLEAVIALHG